MWYSSSPSFIHDEEGFGLEPQELSMFCERSMEMGSQRMRLLMRSQLSSWESSVKMVKSSQNFPEFLKGFRTFQTFSKISQSFQEEFKNKYSESFKIECSRIFTFKSKSFSGKFWNVLEYSGTLSNFILIVVGIHSTTQKGV